MEQPGPDNSLKLGQARRLFMVECYFNSWTKENGEHQVLVFDSKNDPTGLNQVEVPVLGGRGACHCGATSTFSHAVASPLVTPPWSRPFLCAATADAP